MPVAPEPATARIPTLPNHSLTDHLAFIDLQPHDRQQLHDVQEILQAAGTAFVDEFYRHLYRFPEAAKHLQNPELVERLKQAQLAHLTTMLTSEWNDHFLQQRSRIGEVHAAIGIDPLLFIGAYNQYLRFALDTLSKHHQVEHHACVQQVRSLSGAILLDISLTLEAYFTQETQKLRNALDMLWQANADLRQFAQLTSHDLKTPLATVANLCDEVLDEFHDSLPSEAAELITKARDRIFRMSTTIDELLATSIHLSEQSEPEVFSLQRPLHEAVERLRPAMEEKEIELMLPQIDAQVQGDRIKIREAIYNSLSNAVKFTPVRPGKITVALQMAPPICQLSISDNGTGIPPEELQRIFVPFRRLPMHRQIPGSGLGLYFTKTLIEQQGGRVWVESQLGQGSTFYIELRLGPSAQPSA